MPRLGVHQPTDDGRGLADAHRRLAREPDPLRIHLRVPAHRRRLHT